MEIEKKYMSRSSWSRIIDREYAVIDIDDNNLKGKAGLLYMKKVREPLTKTYNSKQITIVNKDYYWLQIGLENVNYWITAMYDNYGNLIQYYIDITKKNFINNDDSYFEDLFVDVVILPDGEKIYLDIDELKKAFDEKVITQDEYILAIDQADYISTSILSHREKFDDFCYKYFNLCKNKFGSKPNFGEAEYIKKKSV